MAAVSDFGAQENKVCHCFHFFPIYLPCSGGTGCPDLSSLNVEFRGFGRTIPILQLGKLRLQNQTRNQPTYFWTWNSFHCPWRWWTGKFWPSWQIWKGWICLCRAHVQVAVVRPVFPLVNIQPPALSSLEWNVKLQMGEQSAPWLPGTAGGALWIFQRAGTVPRGLINCSGLPRYTTPFLPYSTRAAHLPPPHLGWSWKPGLAYLSISQLPATHLVHGRKEGNLAWTSGVWVLLTAQQCFALGSFWGSQIPGVFESHLQPYDESTVVHLILQMTKQNLGEVKRLLGDLYSTRVAEFKTRAPLPTCRPTSVRGLGRGMCLEVPCIIITIIWTSPHIQVELDIHWTLWINELWVNEWTLWINSTLNINSASTL